MSHAAALAPLLAACLALPAGSAGAAMRGSALAVPVVAGGERPEPLLAQRAIERAWGPSDDSLYVAVDVPEWRSEGLAAALSAVVPGAGQLYSTEGNSLWFAFAEAVGWTANRIYLHKAHTGRDHSVAYAGAPTDTASAWSFERWSAATGLNAGELEAVYARDPQAFYELIARDASYLGGWSGVPADTRDVFRGLRADMRTQYERARLAGYALWLNHVLAAVDALHAVRMHNLTLQNNLELRLRSSWRSGQPAVVATLVRRF
jgi:hypothetical protein